MTPEEFKDKLKFIQEIKCETKEIELKKAAQGCPKRLYDTLSSFSNQNEGGVIYFGIDEENDYSLDGVYDAQDLQKKINEQCLQMEPVVRPVLTVLSMDGKNFVAAEIPGIEISERPCYYRGQGRLKGAYCRIGDSDEPMTEYEVYSYEAYRKKYQDDIRTVARADAKDLDHNKLTDYLLRIKLDKPNLSLMDDEKIKELMSITEKGVPTLMTCLLFSPYPQAYFPQLCIIAVLVPGRKIGELGADGERFIDNKRIEGTIPQMLDLALSFVKNNSKQSTVIDNNTGLRRDIEEYPLIAVREIILNALEHRDYSQHTEGMPIQLLMFEDRLEVHSPGGLYGRLTVDKLGKMQPDTRNPVLASALEILKVTENRYSGIPTICSIYEKEGLPAPEFRSERGTFIVTLYKKGVKDTGVQLINHKISNEQKKLLEFCKAPKSRHEIAAFLGISSVTYAINQHVKPLIKLGLIAMTIPDRPGSPKQCFYSCINE